MLKKFTGMILVLIAFFVFCGSSAFAEEKQVRKESSYKHIKSPQQRYSHGGSHKKRGKGHGQSKKNSRLEKEEAEAARQAEENPEASEENSQK